MGHNATFSNIYIITYNFLMVDLCVKGQRGSWDDEKCLLDMFCLKCHVMKVCVLTLQVLDTVRDRESLMGWSFWGFSPCLYFACLARVDWLASNHFYSSSFVVVAWVECFNVFALMYLFFKVKYVFGTADFQYFVRSYWWKLKINMVQGQVFVVPVWGSYTFV